MNSVKNKSKNYLSQFRPGCFIESLKNAITDQLQLTNKGHGQLSLGKEEPTRFGNIDRGIYCQRPVQNSGFIEHQPVWRPQRGLPERAVTVLRAWLFEHFLHP